MGHRFIVDLNVGKLAKWLCILGYDTILFASSDDNALVRTAFRENRIVLTRDTHILERRVVATGRLKAILRDTWKTPLAVGVADLQFVRIL